MKFFSTTLLIVCSLSLSSCSNYIINDKSIQKHVRSPGSEKHLPIELVDLLSIKNSNIKSHDQNFIKKFKLSIHLQGIELIFKANDLLPSDTAYRIVPVLTDKNYQIQIHYAQSALTDQNAFLEIESFFKMFFEEKYTSENSLIELFYNAKNNHIPALHTLAKIRHEALLNLNNQHNENAINQWQALRTEFTQLEKKERVKIKDKENARKLVMEKLDGAVEDDQFRTLIAKNDRKGVAALLRSYLPWEQMAPFEVKFWTTQLEIIANPLPIEEKIFILRGIDDDVIQIAHDVGPKLSKEEALKEHKIFLMSTMMTKNQGTWNRRLRSLTTMNEKFIGIDDIHNTSEYSRVARITNMFMKHSVDPIGSPFLSLTPNIQVASQFGSERMTGFLIDPRAIHFNYASHFKTEAEFLLPLMTFPDELIFSIDFNLDEEASEVPLNKRLAFMDKYSKEKLINKLAQHYGKASAEDKYQKVLKNTLAHLKVVTGTLHESKMGHNIDKMMKPVVGAIDLEVPLSPEKEGSCLDMVKPFMK